MTKFKEKWLILIILIYFIPLFVDQSERAGELIWLIYLFPSVFLPFYYGLKAGLTSVFIGIFIHAVHEVHEIVFNHEKYYLDDFLSMGIITFLNITVAFAIGRLVDKLKVKQLSLEKVVAKMEFMAYHDYLTGLPNRWNFEMKLKAALEEAKQAGSLLAVLFLDLDRFKLINDSLGHAVGDMLLKDVSKRIQMHIKENDCLARQGGDEFILFLSGFSTKSEVEAMVTSIHQCIQAPFKIQDKEFFISSSIGISIYPIDGGIFEELIKQADIAMYTAKDKGGNGFQWHSSAKQQEFHDVVKIETHLRKALQKNEFTLFYQPLVDLSNNKIYGFEALIRWYNSELGMVPPSEFIPLVEEIGMITILGEWVLNEACLEAKALSRAFREPIQIAVNISSKQFQDDHFIDIVKQVLFDTKLPPSQLELEITESVSLENIDRVILKLKTLQEMGISISIDDFGTGYSSISYLKYLPVDTLKIDQSFVQNMMNNMKDRALVESVISLAKSFGFHVIAEGVETEEQLKMLKMYDCGKAQGYYFSKPIPMKEVYHLFEENKRYLQKIENVS